MTMTNSMLNHCCDYVNVKSGRRALCAPNLWSKLEIYALCFPGMLDRVNWLFDCMIDIMCSTQWRWNKYDVWPNYWVCLNSSCTITPMLQNLKNNIFRHLEGGEATWLFSDISTIPVSELNLSSTQHRKKLIVESSCVLIEYVKKSGYTSESKGTQLLLYDQNVPFVIKPAKLIEQVLIITQTTLSSF